MKVGGQILWNVLPICETSQIYSLMGRQLVKDVLGNHCMEDPVVPLERNLYGHRLAGLLWERQFEKNLLKHGWEKIPNWECFFGHREKGLFSSVYVDDIKLDGKKQNLDPMWKVLNKEVDLGEPTSFLDHVYLGCTQRQCEKSKDIVDNYRTNVESRISVGRSREITISSKSSYFFMVLWHGCSCKDVCGAILWVSQQIYTTTLQSIYSMHWWPPLQRRRNEICWRIVKYMLSNCSEMFFSKRIGRPDILWSVNKLARWITKWTKACDKRLNRLISSIHHTCEYKQYCHLGNTVKLQTGTVSRLWLRRRSWRFKIHFWRNIMRFWKSYVCSSKLDVQETNCCFSQFNRIWNHLFGHRTEIGWFARSGTMGSYCFCSWKYFSYFRSNGETCEWWRQTPQVSQ